MWTSRPIRTEDGVLLSCYGAGVPALRAGAGGAPTLVFCPGLGGGHDAITPQVRYLGDRVRFLSWDYRGLHGGSPAAAGGALDCTIDRQVDDLFAVMEADGAPRACLVGWSMGAQVAIEAYRRRPDAVSALVFVGATGRRPFEALTRGSTSARAMAGLFALARRGERLAVKALQRVLRRGDLAAWITRAGLVAPGCDREAFEQLIGRAKELDAAAYVRTAFAAEDHDPRDLGDIHVRTLLVAGDHDPFTPPALAHQLARNLPDSEVLIVPGGRHYVTLEFPEFVSLGLERFLAAAGLL